MVLDADKSSVIWPQLTQAFWANGNIMKGAYLACLSGLGINTGGAIGGALAKPIGRQKTQMIVAMACGGALLAGK